MLSVFLGLYRLVYQLLPDQLRHLTPYREFLSRLNGKDEVGFLGNVAKHAANKFVSLSLGTVQAGKDVSFGKPAH